MAVHFNMLVAYTVNEKGAKEMKVRSACYEEQRITVMLFCIADGHKLPPIIFKRKVPPAWEAFPRNVTVRANENGWMTGAMVEDWIKSVWPRHPLAIFVEELAPCPRLVP